MARDDARATRTIAAHYRVVVIGGGNAGLSVAGRLHRLGIDDVVVVEPRSKHLYKPLFSHIAGGTAPASMAVRDQASVMPKDTAEKHGVSLARASDMEILVFVEDARKAYGEVRYRARGRIDDAYHCLAFTYREGRVRVISLRRAHEKEIRRYASKKE